MELSSLDSNTGIPKWLIPEIVFAVLGMTAGLFMVFANAPFEAPDEASHFWRAYHIYSGNVLSVKSGNRTGGRIPVSIAHAHLPFENLVGHPESRVDRSALSAGMNEPFDAEEMMFKGMGFAALYSPAVYGPQIAGIAFGRACHLSALGMMYAGRIANLLFWGIVTTMAIRITPAFKWVFVLVALLPMNVFLAASLSADAPADSIASLLFALVLYAVWQKQPLSLMQMLAIVLLCIVLAFVKLPYVPLSGLVLLIPLERFKGRRNKVLFCGGAIGLTFLGTLLWSQAIRDLYSPTHGANAPVQWELLMAHPWSFPGLLIHSFLEHASGIVISFIGKLGFLDTPLPFWVYCTYPLILAGVALLDSSKERFVCWPQRLWIGLLCLGVFVLVHLSMFLTWTPVGETVIEGVQGRYFLPIAVPALLVLFYNQRFDVSNQKLIPRVVIVYSLIVLAVTCRTVYMRYFGPAA